MKKLIISGAIFCTLVLFFSSCHSHRRGCDGKGWYGHRNLSKLDAQHIDTKYIVLQNKEILQKE